MGNFTEADIKTKYSREVKLKIVVEALSGNKTIAQIASDHGVHPTQIATSHCKGLIL